MSTKICKLCGEPFEPRHGNQKICDREHFNTCPVCGKKIPYKIYTYCCSKECTQKQREQTSLKKYGTIHPQASAAVQAKIRETCRKHFGVDYPGQNKAIRKKQVETFLSNYGKSENPEGHAIRQAKTMETCKEKYGVEFVTQSEDFKSAAKQTLLNKYGVDNVAKADVVKAQMKATSLARYGVDNPMKNEIIKERQIKSFAANHSGNTNPMLDPHVKSKISTTMTEKYGVPWYVMTLDAREKCGDISLRNKHVFDYIVSKGLDCVLEYPLGSNSYDLCIPSKQLLIEVDSTYCHNVIGNHWGIGKSKYYHQDKSKFAEANGFRCVHIFDWMDVDSFLDLVLDHNIAFSDFVDPKLYWCNERNELYAGEYSDDPYNSELLNLKYLPVYDAGQYLEVHDV